MPDPFVEWKAPYGSAQLNRKLSQVTDAGVYEGYWVSVSGADEITIGTSSPDGSRDPANVAVVERGGYSLTVRNPSAQTLPVPSTEGLYHAVVEAKYEVGQATVSQLKIVADGNEAGHEIIVGSVRRESDGSLTALPKRFREEDRRPSVRQLLKPSDETVTSSTTLQDDDHLQGLILKPQKTYLFDSFLKFKGGEGGYKYTLNGSTDVALRGHEIRTTDDTASDVSNSIITESDVQSGAGGSSSFNRVIRLVGRLTTGNQPKIALRWAQVQSSTAGTTLRVGSYIKINRLK